MIAKELLQETQPIVKPNFAKHGLGTILVIVLALFPDTKTVWEFPKWIGCIAKVKIV